MIKRRKVYQSKFKKPKILSNKRRTVKKDTGFVRMFKLIFKMSFILIIILGISYLFNNDYLKIKRVESRTDNNFYQKVDKIVKKSLSESKLFLFQNSSFLIFSTSDLENSIKNAIPEIKSVTIKKRFPDKLEVKTTLHEASIGWETGDKKYLLNEDGYILKETDKFENIVSIKDMSNIPVKKDVRIVYPNFIYFTQQTSLRLNDLKISTSSMEINETTFIIKVHTNSGYYIIFDTTKDIDSQIKKLKEAIDYLDTSTQSLEYIDVTVKDKAIYKTR